MRARLLELESTTTPTATSLSITLFLAAREAENCSPVTIRDYESVLERFERLPSTPAVPGELTEDHVVLYLAHLRRGGAAAGTIAYHQRHLYAWIGWLLDRETIDRDIRRQVKRVRVPRERKRTVSETLFDDLIAVVADRPKGRKIENYFRNIAIVRLLWATGIRRSELAEVRYEGLELRKTPEHPLAPLLVVRAEVAKSRRERRVPFDAQTKAAVLEYVLGERGGAGDGPLFYGRSGDPMSSNAIRLVLDKLAKRASTPDNRVEVSSHDFRRGFAARMRTAGLDVAHVAKLLGHSTLTMTLRYSEAGEEDASISAYRKAIG